MNFNTAYKFIHWSMALTVTFMVLTIMINALRPFHSAGGYLLIVLYLFRMVVTLRRGTAYVSPFAANASTADRLKGWTYLLFYICLALALYSGYLFQNGPDYLHTSMHWIHMRSMYYLSTFAVVHTAYALLVETGLFAKAGLGKPVEKT